MLQFAFDALVALFPTSLGQKTKAGSLAVTVASDQDVLATSTKQSDGSQKAQTVDGSGNVQPAGDTAARPIFAKLSDGAAALFDAAARAGWVKVTDGTNTMPTADAVGRALFAKITDGTALLFDAAARAGWVKVTDGTNTMPSGDAAARPITVRQSDGSAFYTGAKTGQLPSALGTQVMTGSVAVTIASDDTLQTAIKNSVAAIPAKGTATMSGSTPVTLATDDAAAKALTPQSSISTPAAVTTGANTTQGQLGSNVATRGVIVQADSTNTISLRIGDSNTSSTRGIQLAPGKAVFVPCTNSNAIYYCNESATASKLNFLVV